MVRQRGPHELGLVVGVGRVAAGRVQRARRVARGRRRARPGARRRARARARRCAPQTLQPTSEGLPLTNCTLFTATNSQLLVEVTEVPTQNSNFSE